MYDKIKKQNGESFAKAIRAFDSGIFDIPNLDEIVKYAGIESEPIMNFLVSLKDVKIDDFGISKDPIELLKDAGYHAFYADSLEKQNSIAKFFHPKEKLCTFKDKERFEKYHIIHCVKENATDIKRNPSPEREDEYGTSVMSIQILKSGGFISIKNRYNHSVKNPDNTLNSNPDNIIIGLSKSIKDAYGADFSSQKVSLPNNYAWIDNRIVQYYKEAENTYIGDGFYAKDGKVFEIDKQSEIMMDHFIYNFKTNEIKSIFSKASKSFIDAFKEETKDKKIKIVRGKKGRICLYANGQKILQANKSNIVYLNFPNITKVGKLFLYHNKTAKEVYLPNVRIVEAEFFYLNTDMSHLYLPRAKEIHRDFLYNNKDMEQIFFPVVEIIKDNFFHNNNKLYIVDLPSVKKIGGSFLQSHNCEIQILNLRNVVVIGDCFMFSNNTLKILDMPFLKSTMGCFLMMNDCLEVVNLPSFVEPYQSFLARVQNLKLCNMQKEVMPERFKSALVSDTSQIERAMILQYYNNYQK